MDKKEEFLKEYVELCRKHGMYVDRGPYGDALMHVREIERCEECKDPEFWFNDHLADLRKTRLNHYGKEH